MAEAATRREERRRRILENSEFRLQKITGQTSEKIEDNHEKQCVKSDPKSVETSTNANGILPREALINTAWDDPLEIDDEIVEEDLQSTVLRKRTVTQESIRHENGNSQGLNSTFATENSDDFLRNLNHKTMKKPQFSTESQSIFTNLLVTRLSYVVLAAFLNFMLIFKLENLFGISIIVPFLLMFISRFWICAQSFESQNRSILMTALFLCNIKPELIHRLRTTMNFFSLVTQDLSVFLFSFTMMYYTISGYWIDMDALLPNTVEIIVDRHAST